MDPDARVELNVPYENKDDAKNLGAKWDGDKRTWYTTAGHLAADDRLTAFNPTAPTIDVECPF